MAGVVQLFLFGLNSGNLTAFCSYASGSHVRIFFCSSSCADGRRPLKLAHQL